MQSQQDSQRVLFDTLDLERLIPDDHYLEYRWFCQLGLHDMVPDHSSMTRIRDRFGEAIFTEIFEQLIARWQEEGHTYDHRIVADDSLVEANAAVDSLV